MKRRDFFRGSASAAMGAALGWSSIVPNRSLAAQASSGDSSVSSHLRDDLALVNADIVTLNPQQPRASAALIRNGKIVLVGTNEEVQQAAGSALRFDAGGRTVVPGFIDAHTHFEMACNARAYQVPIHSPPYSSLSEMKDALRAAANETPDGEWIIGRGSFGMADLVEEGRLPLREELDAVTERHPLIMFAGFHVAMLNTLGLTEAGLWDPNSESIPRAATVHRDAYGVPTGLATEVWDTLPPYSRTQVRESIRNHAPELFVNKGITSVHTLPVGPDDVRAIQDLHATGDLDLRVRVYHHVPLVTSLESLLSTGFKSGVGNELFRFGGIKIFVDGIGRDALGNPLDDSKWTQEELNEFVSSADNANLQLMMHVLTDIGENMGMNALAHTARVGERKLNHRFEHANGGSSIEMIRRYKELDLRPVITVSNPEPTPPDSRRERATPRWRTMVEEGVEPIACSDATGTVPEFSPLGGIAHMMTSSLNGGSTPSGETLSFEDALRTYTLFPARSAYEDHEKGSIEVNKLGDLVVLSADPRTLEGPELWSVDVATTIVGGRVVYDAS